MDCIERARKLARLADHVSRYSAELRQAGFACCHVNDDWIAQHCGAADIALHMRYLSEFAREVLTSGKHSPDFGDAQDCHSPWLNELKAMRLAAYGPDALLWANPDKRHLAQLSPGWREFMRVKGSSAHADQMQAANQIASFMKRRSDEMAAHSEAIAGCRDRLPTAHDGLSLQAYFASELMAIFESLGAQIGTTLQRNQIIQRDERIVTVTFFIAEDCLFVMSPVVTLSAPAKPKAFEGSLGIGFMLASPTALAAPTFDFKAGTVVHLHELLPSKFNGYGRFSDREEFCLNVLAWKAALRILLPDVLHPLRSA